MIISEYLTYGYPTKRTVNELVRKRGFLRKETKKEAITNNVLIEELLGPDNMPDGHMGCICIEDIIDNIVNCYTSENDSAFHKIREVLWPFQLASLKETVEGGNIEHDATKRTIRKKNTKVRKGGYIGFMGDNINSYIHQLI